MNHKIETGQFWKSKDTHPVLGQYTVEILEVGYEIVMTRFTASGWEDGHWIDNHTMTIRNLLENYEPQDQK